jgi:hypothetical protein
MSCLFFIGLHISYKKLKFSEIIVVTAIPRPLYFKESLLSVKNCTSFVAIFLKVSAGYNNGCFQSCNWSTEAGQTPA